MKSALQTILEDAGWILSGLDHENAWNIGSSIYGNDMGEIDADIKMCAENNEREAALWGNLLDDKRLLQTRGYVIFWKDHAKGLICCDNKIVSSRQLVILADRTRRDLTT